MKKLLIAALFLCEPATGATDISGKWSGAPFYMVLRQAGAKLDGTGGISESQQFPFENGAVDGDRSTFSIGPYQFDLRVSGSQIRGEMKDGDQTIAVYLKRVETQDGSQAAAASLAFEVASVKKAPLAMGSGMRS